MTGVPFELANQVPAVKQYMDLVAEVARHDRSARRAVGVVVPAVGDRR